MLMDITFRGITSNITMMIMIMTTVLDQCSLELEAGAEVAGAEVAAGIMEEVGTVAVAGMEAADIVVDTVIEQGKSVLTRRNWTLCPENSIIPGE
jgi:hypothetical protein